MCSAQSKTLIFISLFLFATFNYCFALENNDAVSENGTALPVAEIFMNRIRNAGYPAELHTVHTVDGYILNMLRIPYSAQTKDKPRKPVFVMHPFLESSHAWIVQGPGKALAYLLTDAGYDVWLGNARGTEMSREHSWLNANESAYWDYSWQDIGQEDLPACIDYVLAITNNEKLSYVGFSQGTTVFFVLVSTRPEYNKKIDHASLIAPVAFLQNSGSPFFRMLNKYYMQMKRICKTMGYHKITRESMKLLKKAERLCKGANPRNSTSCKLFTGLVGFENVKPEIIPSILRYVPAGVSLKQILHFSQVVRSGMFKQFDYEDDFLNSLHYGRRIPPLFDLQKIRVDIHIYLSTDDKTTKYENVMRLKDFLPNVKGTHVTEGFRHSGFIYNDKAAELVYGKLIANMQGAADINISHIDTGNASLIESHNITSPIQ